MKGARAHAHPLEPPAACEHAPGEGSRMCESKRVIVVHLRVPTLADGSEYRRLAQWLKQTLRQKQLRCIDVKECATNVQETSNG